MVISTNLGLDKVKIGMDCKKEVFPTMCERLLVLAEDFGKEAHYISVGKSLRLSKADVGVDVRICAFTKYGNFHRVSYEFNARELTPAAAANLQEISNKYFAVIDQEGCCDFRSALLQGHFTKVEICQDFPGKAAQNLLLHHMHSHAYFRYPGGGSQYCGAIKADSRTILYDKSKQLLETGKKPSVFAGLLRLERRISEPTSLSELIETNRPFEKVRILSVDKLVNIDKSSSWKKFVNSATAIGVAPSMKGITSKSLRLCFRDLVLQCQVDWFDPSKSFLGWGMRIEKQLCLQAVL